ncbi:Regulator of RNase E activity RraA [Devosia enhydra]|uniref:Regulator of RNase E activity RraA n=1 Tax=Devosia enhydra TaxID=665118 RepID=A0A1K2HU98_9HYPH|nr:ribonuclease activity regulator RraA [Devosia enhydra]SFZ81948.1 Regulator of RNase E activity RraA [Devosia enhydra]
MTDILAPMAPELRKKFLEVSTATLATTLFRRGLRCQFVQGVKRLSTRKATMVGPAFTLRYIPAREDLDVLAAFRDPRHPQRHAVETIPSGHVLVMDCRGDATAASAGAILLTRLVVRGCAGVVTDGGLRDADDIAALPIQTYCATPSAPTNLTRHHAIDINLPIGCGTAPVFPGDIMVGDGDGVMVVPREIAEEVAEEAWQQEQLEAFVIGEIAAGRPLPGTYPPNEETLMRYRTSRNGAGPASAGQPAI